MPAERAGVLMQQMGLDRQTNPCICIIRTKLPGTQKRNREERMDSINQEQSNINDAEVPLSPESPYEACPQRRPDAKALS